MFNNSNTMANYYSNQGNVYGDGVYFAADASVSSKYAEPDTNGNRYMFYCSVLTGEYTIGTKGLKSPPVKNLNAPDCYYDSTCDNIPHPTMFIIFSDNSVYATHLVIFRQHSKVPWQTINWWEPLNKLPSKFFEIYSICFLTKYYMH